MQVLGVDTGGTFTDLVDDDGRVVKVCSTPDDPGRAVRNAVDAAPVTDRARLLVSLEAILGIVLAGLFLNSIAAKITSAGEMRPKRAKEKYP